MAEDHEMETGLKLQAEWDKLHAKHQPMYADFGNYVASLGPALEKAFILNNAHVNCIDEGTPGGKHLAGAGILLSEDRAAAILSKMGVDGITSHAGCGAAAMAAQQHGHLDAEKYGQEWSQKIAKRLGVPYIGHITYEQIQRPPDFHNALVAYIDHTGKFNYANTPGLPPGFIISSGLIPDDVAEQETSVAINIALGHHGFGNLFSADNPFILVNIADPKRKETEETELLEKLAEKHGNRVIVRSFNAPQ